jgi:hypothetical protein
MAEFNFRQCRPSTNDVPYPATLLSLIKYGICSTYQQLWRTAIFTFQNKTKAQRRNAGLGLRVQLYKIMISAYDDICPSLLTLDVRRQIQIAHTEPCC